MVEASDATLVEAVGLWPSARAEVTDPLLASPEDAIDPLLEREHLEQVRRRIARVEAGESELVPGEQVLGEGRALLAALALEKQRR